MSSNVAISKVAVPVPKVANAIPKVANAIPKVANAIPKVVFVIPYRNRPQHKFFFSNYLTSFLKGSDLNYEIYFSCSRWYCLYCRERL